MNVEKVSLYVLYNANEVREQSPFFCVQKSVNPKTMPNSLEDAFPLAKEKVLIAISTIVDR